MPQLTSIAGALGAGCAHVLAYRHAPKSFLGLKCSVPAFALSASIRIEGTSSKDVALGVHCQPLHPCGVAKGQSKPARVRTNALFAQRGYFARAHPILQCGRVQLKGRRDHPRINLEPQCGDGNSHAQPCSSQLVVAIGSGKSRNMRGADGYQGIHVFGMIRAETVTHCRVLLGCLGHHA